MSEIAPETTVAESAPTSTADVASNVIDSFDNESTDSGIDVSGDTPAVGGTTTDTPLPEATVAEPVKEPAKDLSDEDKEAEALLAEFGYKDARKPDGREHWMPRSKALKMIASGLRKGRDKWGTEKAPLESRVQELDGHLSEMYQDIMGEPKALIEKLAGVNPKFRTLLEPQAQTPQTQAAPDAEMPQPDVALADGSRTYSLDGLKKLLDWNTQRVKADTLATVEQKLKPWEDRDKQERERAETQKTMEAVRTRTGQMMQEAQKWPLFGQLAADGSLTEFQQAVLSELQKDTAEAKAAGKRPSLTLEGAYIRVAGPRYTEDDAKKRERLFKEISAANRSTPTVARTGDVPKQTGPATTQDIAARTLARLERGA